MTTLKWTFVRVLTCLGADKKKESKVATNESIRTKLTLYQNVYFLKIFKPGML